VIHLADWIVTAVAGPLLVACVIGVWRFGQITRDNRAAIADLEAHCATRNGCPGKMAEIDRELALMKARMDSMVRVEEDAWKRNDKAHERIERAIEAHRKERLEQMAEMKRDLIREIRRNGNGQVRDE
jgi:hypothetical protein